MNHKLYNTQALAARHWSRELRPVAPYQYYETENVLCTKFALVLIRLRLI